MELLSRRLCEARVLSTYRTLLRRKSTALGHDGVAFLHMARRRRYVFRTPPRESPPENITIPLTRTPAGFPLLSTITPPRLTLVRALRSVVVACDQGFLPAQPLGLWGARTDLETGICHEHVVRQEKGRRVWSQVRGTSCPISHPRRSKATLSSYLRLTSAFSSSSSACRA